MYSDGDSTSCFKELRIDSSVLQHWLVEREMGLPGMLLSLCVL
jgi:hypothetical protein